MGYTIICPQDGTVRYPLHMHKNYEIMFYLEGEGYMKTDRGDIPFSPGKIILVPPNIRHGSVSQSGFKNISIEGEFDRCLHFDEVKSLSDNEAQEGKTLVQIIYANRYGNSAYIASLCSAYLHFILQRIKLDSAMQKSVQRLISEISQNAFDSQIHLAAILSKSGYSEDYIRSCFKDTTGKTPHEFLTDIRIKHACFLIDIYRQTLSLSEIAERCGYLDYIYFSKKFKSVTGMSPREYRNS
ncbi:MAG: AraC family transcriptional regulator [Ruminococcaceae bacterium]|nr:AraC family transcriptional regulator [Oscillospiraceae bacterium]